ncbi:MAG: MmgE/PrpD family protein [Candidatus Binatia bacterium]
MKKGKVEVAATMKPLSQGVAEFVHGLKLKDIPPEIVEKTKLIFLDSLGIALASSTMDFGPMVLDVAQTLGGPEESRLIGTPHKVAAANAVLANGTLIHGLDYDDTLEEAIVHTGCASVASALAVGEAMGASGGRLVEGLVAGIEVMGKVGLVSPGRFHARGFHPTGLCAPFAAATCTGKLYALDVDQLMDAFGLCGSQSSGIIEYLADGSWTKRLHPGWSAHGGVIATLLARKGFHGPSTVFEGRRGFYKVFGGDPGDHLERLRELGRTWEIPRIAFKSYPCGSISHPYIDCALKLRQKCSIRPEDIEEITCRTAQGPVDRLWEPLAAKRSPQTAYGAKFSLPYSIAVMLVRGKAGLEEFSDSSIRDPRILAMAEKVGYELDPSINYPRHFSGHVRIKLKDGTVAEENQAYPRGGLGSPLPPEEIHAKFRANARMALSQAQVEKIVTMVQGLEQLPSIMVLTDLLAPSDGY